ncbi:hypothetical protein [Mucilaginibacter segetis]|uniref:Uncharacterized protein n=1 Tax=Mucilaginibacter segetis TaxID=2793071 RepID=A0A934PV71_9SPHI|nr:hypothetical protein [Mucilaginibacter segetis]MBK0380010.1 hypothetical protein [Mucilaginibacter segetis]
MTLDTIKIDEGMRAGRKQYVTLKRKVSVFYAYLTALVDRELTLNFRKDIYQLYKRLANMLLYHGNGN